MTPQAPRAAAAAATMDVAKARRLINSSGSWVEQARENIKFNDQLNGIGVTAATNLPSSTASNDLDNQMQPVTFYLWMKLPFVSSSLEQMIKGAFLWFNSPKRDLADMKPLVFTLPQLNFALEKTARDQAERAPNQVPLFTLKPPEPDPRAPKRFKGQTLTGLSEALLEERTFVRELDLLYVPDVCPDEPFVGDRDDVFSLKYFAGGCLQHVERKELRTEVQGTVAIAKHMEVPNVFAGALRANATALGRGVAIGFVAKYENTSPANKLPYDSFYGPDGSVLGARTSVPCIQVKGITCERRLPRHCSGADGRPDDDDLDAIVERRVEQRLHRVEANGLIALEADENAPPLQLLYASWSYGLYTPVGTTTKTHVAIAPSTSRMACRLPSQYVVCNGSHRLEVQLALV